MIFHGPTVLLVVGLGFAIAWFIGGLCRLPRRIRFALTMSGVTLFVGAVIGIILQLIFSGEIFKALRMLDADRKKQAGGV